MILLILGLLVLAVIVYFAWIGIAGLITASREVGRGVREGLAAEIPTAGTSRAARRAARKARKGARRG